MREFVTAATRGEKRDEEEPITFLHDGREVTFFKPSSGQFMLMSSIGIGGSSNPRSIGTFIALFMELMDEDTQGYFEGRLLDRHDTFDIDSEGGIFDIWEYLAEEWSARPTKEPSDYQPPQRATGKRSTAPSRAKGSTSSRSRSTAASR